MAVMTPEQAFELASQLHRDGKLSDAAELYRQILKLRPRHADSLHLLGVVHYQQGDFATAKNFELRISSFFEMAKMPIGNGVGHDT
jgi:hypothetical protein